MREREKEGGREREKEKEGGREREKEKVGEIERYNFLRNDGTF